MRIAVPLALAIAFAAATDAGVRASEAPFRVSGPHVHKNLQIFLLHGASAAGPVPVTLAEALVAGTAKVHETGSVQTLEVENLGAQPLFIQAGDIVKGGQQDRVLTVSVLVPANSGRMPIGSFCVEQGRWSARGMENVKQFASAAEALPSRAAKLAMAMPAAQPVPTEPGVTVAVAGTVRTMIESATGRPRQEQRPLGGAGGDTQSRVWREVENIQAGLSAKLGATVKARDSGSSLQLSLENERLTEARQGYMTALKTVAASEADVVGFAFAVDGKIVSADVYPSNGLFRKMWDKGLAAAVTEALSSKTEDTASTITTAEVDAFVLAAEKGKADSAPVATLGKRETRDADKSLAVISSTNTGAVLHRNYLAK